jgi:hypothetical protein
MKHQHTFVISLVVLVLAVAFTAWVQASAEEPIETDVQQPKTAAESSKEEVLSASEHFATNPELKIVERYANLADEVGTGSAFYAANPKLMIAGRYTAPVLEDQEVSSSEFFAANPELMAAGRYISQEKATESEIFAANPELMAAHRYPAAATGK